MHVQLGVLTVPAVAAQDAADAMVAAGIKGIWNFTPVKLKVPEGVVTQSEDLSSGLAVLSVKISRLNNPDKYKSGNGSDIEV
jgi:redox-sensing transcriptional repressor